MLLWRWGVVTVEVVCGGGHEGDRFGSEQVVAGVTTQDFGEISTVRGNS